MSKPDPDSAIEGIDRNLPHLHKERCAIENDSAKAESWGESIARSIRELSTNPELLREVEKRAF